MNNSQIATAIALRDLKCYSLDTISDRILLQKKIYLAQDNGLLLGYGYSWYIHGPYSTDLTAVAYQVIPEGLEAIERYRFKNQYKGIIDRVNALENIITEKHLQISVVKWYELLASIAYWYNRGFTSEEQIVEKMRVTKPQFTAQYVKSAFESYMTFKNNNR